MDNITVNELIKVLSELSNSTKEMQIYEICGCVDGKDRIKGFQFHLKDKNLADNYILVPQNKSNVMYDTFGERKIK